MIRDFVPPDQMVVRELVLDGLRERWRDAYDPDANSDLDDISSSYLDEGADVVVLELRGEVVATGVLQPEIDGRGRIIRMSVDRRHRRRGLGRHVVEKLVGRARRRGMVEVVVLTDTPWSSARALYLSCGFEQVGQDETDTHFAMTL